MKNKTFAILSSCCILAAFAPKAQAGDHGHSGLREAADIVNTVAANLFRPAVVVTTTPVVATAPVVVTTPVVEAAPVVVTPAPVVVPAYSVDVVPYYYPYYRPYRPYYRPYYYPAPHHHGRPAHVGHHQQPRPQGHGRGGR